MRTCPNEPEHTDQAGPREALDRLGPTPAGLIVLHLLGAGPLSQTELENADAMWVALLKIISASSARRW
ncbi:hypothetical protein D6T64_13615 [Cryobacterium melibiosiphilum]|uniref:Uncharacterized protein n=1 Tax=Cryobacterium melibiosiphilum TaxID=995039 RepID=A0A3A5MNK6_9MICO|nr:hypothetical protein [Cryobacterium melibiosiphilum]RJT87636.1 hypothetical protein D6T64_13615 [Cryobacterium melibiosiphilum]